MYDPSLERRDVAVRALHRMWHNRLRDELGTLGLTKEQAVLAFEDQPFPRTERHVFDTIRRCPQVAFASEKLIAKYIFLTWEERRDYYQERGRAS